MRDHAAAAEEQVALAQGGPGPRGRRIQLHRLLEIRTRELERLDPVVVQPLPAAQERILGLHPHAGG